MIEQHLQQPAVAASTLSLPPLTRGLPLVGALPAFIRRPFDFLLEARERYGDIYRLNLGPFSVVVLNHPRHAERMLVEHARNYVRAGAIYDVARPFSGNGLVSSDGPYWLRQRRMMQPHFHRKRLAGLTALMAATIGEELATWEPAARAGQNINLLPAFSRITMKVIVRALFGTSLNDQEVDDLSGDLSFMLDYIPQATVNSKLPSWLPLPGTRRFKRVLQRVNAAIYRLIERVRQSDTVDGTLMGMMLDLIDEETGERMTDEQLRDEAVSLVLAGYETTSLALSWASHYLTQDQAVMARLQDEIDVALGSRTPAFEDIPALKYAARVFQETIRLRPPGWFVSRMAIADDTIDGYTIPAGANVFLLPYTIHHHSGFWEDAERFDPERFTPENTAGRDKFAWIAFGAGQHQCIGRDFAIMEAQLILAMLFQRYRISAEPGSIVKPELSATLRPKNGVTIKLMSR
jgi:cytochrome P450